MKPIMTHGSKKKKAHYVPGMLHNGLLYISGQLSIDPATGRPKEGGIAAQARQALENVDEVLREAGIDRTHLVQCRIYTPDVTYGDEIDRVYAAFLGDHKPARVVVPCGPLHYGCLVEIEAVAAMEKEDA